MATRCRNKGESLIDFPSDYTIVDIETTGLSPQQCEIIEISALKIRNDKIKAKFSTLVKPEGLIGRFITKLTGITNLMVKNAPKIDKVLPKFLEFAGNDCIIGHNVNFDINFIYDNLLKYHQKEFRNSFVDTVRLARRFCEFPSHKLDYLAQKFEISAEGHHRALNDCIMTFEIYKKIKEIAKEQTEI